LAEVGGDPIEVITAEVLAGAPHGFLGRRGGVSVGDVAGLNVGVGSGDDPQAIAENRRLAVAAVMPGVPLITVYQVHSPDCVVVERPWDEADRPPADALVTNLPGVLLGILTADCAPVLLADHKAGVIGAAHAGWKGALGGVIANTVAAMTALGADPVRIAASIGPCIAQVSYEVDDAFRMHFNDAPDNERFFIPGKPGHAYFDLEGYVAARLAEAGITRIEALGLDTYAAPERFFSYRRATHRGEAAYGREIALIGLA
jgi:YfiH family protein